MTNYPKFRGLFAFNTGNSAQFVNNPSIVGTCLTYYWAELEPSSNTYDWSHIERDMKPWVDAGKKVIIRVSASGWKKWQPAQNSGHGTPAWVYAQGVKSVTTGDGSVKPEYWNPHFQMALAAFVQAFAKQYDGNPHVAAIEIGVGDGGETKVDTSKDTNRLKNWQHIGYTDLIWWQTIQKIIDLYHNQFKQTPLVIMPDASFIGGTPNYNEATVTHYAISKNIGIQNNGLVKGQKIDPNWQKVMVISEQRNATSKSGDTLDEDLFLGVTQGSTYILLFAEDIANSSHQATLAKYAAMATKG